MSLNGNYLNGLLKGYDFERWSGQGKENSGILIQKDYLVHPSTSKKTRGMKSMQMTEMDYLRIMILKGELAGERENTGILIQMPQLIY